MAEFEPIFTEVMQLEGGFNLHEVKGDRGGMTYAGISRKFWPNWCGWVSIDKQEFDAKLTQMVREFYREEFWNTMLGDQIKNQTVAYQVFSFSVNAGRTVAKKLAQNVVGVSSDGVFGPKTIAALNATIQDDKDSEIFKLRYSLLAIFSYKNIAYRDKRRKLDTINSNVKFLIGWINRVEKGLNHG